MIDPLETEPKGSFDTRYLAFLEAVAQVRPRLHRYCSRMTGSTLDGEDIAQDTLFEAYRKLDQFDNKGSLTPWIFRIAHNRCIDFLRRRKVGRVAERAAMQPEATIPSDPTGPDVGRALEHIVLALPPKERACLLLKDIFEYSLEEIAGIAGTSVGAVKAALNRGRAKVTAERSKAASTTARPPAPRPGDPELRQILNLYVERFNRRDWDAVRELIQADAALLVADRYLGRVNEAPYFSNYQRSSEPWRLAIGEVENEPVVIVLVRKGDAWTPRAAIRVGIADSKIARITDYSHCPWVFAAAASTSFVEPF